MDLQLRIPVALPQEGLRLADDNSELLAELPLERLQRKFSGLHFAPGKLPLTGHRLSLRPLADEDPVPGIGNDADHDIDSVDLCSVGF